VKNFGCHIGHGTGYACEQPTLRIMDGDVKVSEVSMAVLIKQDIVWLDVSVRAAGRG